MAIPLALIVYVSEASSSFLQSKFAVSSISSEHSLGTCIFKRTVPRTSDRLYTVSAMGSFISIASPATESPLFFPEKIALPLKKVVVSALNANISSVSPLSSSGLWNKKINLPFSASLPEAKSLCGGFAGAASSL